MLERHADRPDAILDTLEGQVPRAPTQAGLHFGLLISASVVVILPLLYLALIAGAVYFAVWWSLTAHPMIRGVTTMILYGLPLAAAVGLAAFLVKPLLAPHRRSDPEYPVTRADEPQLFEVLDRLCAMIRCPVPDDVHLIHEPDAGVTNRRGRLVLAIGLPLFRRLTQREMIGVLAHELGHFTRGAGMTWSRRINATLEWFRRAAFEKDDWDRALLDEANHSIAFVIGIAVMLSRMLLAIPIGIGQVLAAHAMRSMETTADHYAIHIAGGASWIEVLNRLLELELASDVASPRLNAALHEGRLPDDLVAYLEEVRARLPEELLTAHRLAAENERTGLLSSHPAYPVRVAYASKRNQPGMITLDQTPVASTLLQRFDEHCQQVSRLAVRRMFPRWKLNKAVVVSAGDEVDRLDNEREGYDAISRVFGAPLSVRRMLPFPPLPTDEDDEDEPSIDAVRELTERLANSAAAYRAQLDEYETNDTVVARAHAVFERMRAGLGSGGVSSEQEKTARAAAMAHNRELGPQMAERERMFCHRIDATLGLLRLPAVREQLGDDADAIARESAEVRHALHVVARTRGKLLPIRDHISGLSSIAVAASELRSGQIAPPETGERADELAHRLRKDLLAVLEMIEGEPVPAVIVGPAERTMDRHLLPRLHGRLRHTTVIQGIDGGAADFLDLIEDLYVRLMGCLLSHIERIDAAAGGHRRVDGEMQVR